VPIVTEVHREASFEWRFLCNLRLTWYYSKWMVTSF